MKLFPQALPLAALLLAAHSTLALDRTNATFKIFQFPPNMIPAMDGKTNDWDIVPEDYVIGSDQLVDDMHHHTNDPKHLNVRVRVGWVKGLNRLFFLYEADKDYWDFSRPDLHNDTFEVVVDGDLSGGPFEQEFETNRDILGGKWETYMALQNAHAQNYHIFTPAEGKDWCMFWGPQQWAKDLPYANHACNYNFKPGQPGHLVLEFWITPFDYAGAEGPKRAVESVLTENKIIGLAWAVIDYTDPNSPGNNGFWNLSRHHTFFGNADYLCLFKLMPLEPQFRKALDAQWTFQIVDMDRRLVSFQDQSTGQITAWKWEFGDGEISTGQNPIHTYKAAGAYVVVLTVQGAEGAASRFSRVWDVTLK
ncbi:MAG: PKD domain-containing protein [Verrucomicrobiota bacterium]|jgi:hypothetical protein